MNINCIYYVYSMNINCIYIRCTFLSSVLCSGQLQQQQHFVWQGICLATPGNDASSIQGCHCGPDNRVACRAANTAVPLVHWHPCEADQWLDRQRYTYSVRWQIGATLSGFYGLFIRRWRWGVHRNYVSHDAVHELLVSQGSTARHWPGVPIQRLPIDSRWVRNRARAAQSRWDTSWKVQGTGKLFLYVLVIYMIYTLHIPGIWDEFKWYIQNICIVYAIHMTWISHEYFWFIQVIFQN